MKDAHLYAALERAVHRYGSSALPDDASSDASRPCRVKARQRRRTPGWVSIREIEACQPPNTYPRINRREIKVRCAQLARAEGGQVLEMRTVGLRTWVRFAPEVPDQVPDEAAALNEAAPNEAVNDEAAPSEPAAADRVA